MSGVVARVARILFACLLLAAAARVAAQEAVQPLPDREAFLRNARQKLRPDEVFPSQYTFTEREQQVEYDGPGRPGKRTEKVFEIYPSVEGSPPYRRHLSTNGVAVPSKVIQQADDKHRKELLDWARERQRETPAERTRREQKAARERQEAEKTLDEALRIFDIRMVGRATIRGRPAIEMSLTPKPGVKPTVKGLSLLQKVKGRAWVDEQDYEVVRLEGETTDTIGIALGLLARINKGTTFSFERQKSGDGTWLPLRAAIHAMARIALFKRLDREVITDFRDYRKFTVDTSESFTLPKGGK